MTPMNRDDNRFDILRLFAAWLVVFSHCYPLTGRDAIEPMASTLGVDTLGGVGVAIFFVLSGYLVTLSLERSPSLFEFARRRALRIYPGLIVICLLTVLVLGPLLTTLTQAAYWQNSKTWGYLTAASAVRIHYPLPGVFTDNPYPSAVNGSLWSLPYEIRCYVVLALLSLVPGALRYKTTLVVSGLALLLVGATATANGSFALPAAVDYQLGKLSLLFALGAVFACWRAHIRPLLWPALLLLAAALLLPKGSGWQLLAYLLGVGTLTLWLALYAHWLPRVPARVGDWSYGAYLYGFPVQQVLAHFKLHEASFVGYVLASTVITFALAGLSWHLVEKQALRWK
jgi:peptidoglycan/LPS O-acetylase OafA/YrhL